VEANVEAKPKPSLEAEPSPEAETEADAADVEVEAEPVEELAVQPAVPPAAEPRPLSLTSGPVVGARRSRD
jgi:hypothetical protein